MDMFLDSRNETNYKEIAKYLINACDDYCVAIDYSLVRIEPGTHSAQMMDLVRGPIVCPLRLTIYAESNSNSKE